MSATTGTMMNSTGLRPQVSHGVRARRGAPSGHRAWPASSPARRGHLSSRLGDRLTARVASRSAALDSLLGAIEGTERGLTGSAAKQSEILELVDALAVASAGRVTTGGDLSATWKLLWTTEKETLFILERAPVFGTEAGDVFQVIDVDNSLLQNVITFPPDGAFIVTSDVSVAGDQRMDFKFNAAKLKLPKRDLPFPPFGQGWFETVYLDDRIRIARDIRGDTLIVVRDGPPRVFA